MGMTIHVRPVPVSVALWSILSVSGIGQQVDGEIHFNQTFQGAITAHNDVDLVMFQEVEGSLISATATRVGNSGVKPRVDILDQAMNVLDTAAFSTSGAGKYKVKGFPAPYTGTYYLRATSNNELTGLYKVKLKGKPATGVTVSGDVGSVAELEAVSFAARGGSRISGSIKRKSGDLEPIVVEIAGPTGAVALGNHVKETGGKVVFSNIELPVLGDYTLRFTGQSSTTGDYKASFEVEAPKPLKGSVFEPGHPSEPDLNGPALTLTDIFFGRGLRTPDGLSMDVVNPLTVVATDPISGLPLPGTLSPLFTGDSLSALIDLNLGPLYSPRVVARNGVFLLRFNSKVEPTSLNLVDGRLGPNSPIHVAVNGQSIPIEVFVKGQEIVLNPVTDEGVGFPPSPLAIDGAGNAVVSPKGSGSLSISSKGLFVLQNTKGGGYKPRPDGLGSPDSGGIPIGFNPGNQLLDFFNEASVGADITFGGFLPDVRAPRLIREYKYAGAFTPDLSNPVMGDQFTATTFTVVTDSAFSVLAKKGKGEWAGGVLRLRPDQASEEEVIITSNTVMDLGGGLFRNELKLAAPMKSPPAVGQEYEIVRAEYFEPDPLSPLEPALFDPLSDQNTNNTDLLNFVTIFDRNGVEQDATAPVDPISTFDFLFDEPMSAESFRPYESFGVTSDPPSVNPGLVEVGHVVLSDAGKRVTFRPEREVQFGAAAGTAQPVGFGPTAQQLRFRIKVAPQPSTVSPFLGQAGLKAYVDAGHIGVTDTGGQPLAFPLNMLSSSSPTVQFSFAFSTFADPTLLEYGAIVHRFQGQAKTGFSTSGSTGITFVDMPVDICGPNGNVYGPKIADVNLFANGFLSGAPVQFFQKIHDDLNPPPNTQMTAFPFGAATPIGGFAVVGGARFIHVYRAVDASPDWEALAGTALDLRQIAWAPIGGPVTNTTLPDLQIHAGHSHIIPDTKQSGGIPGLGQTGLCGTNNSNQMGGHFATLGNPNSAYIKGAYDATVFATGQELRRELVWGSLKAGEVADRYVGHAYNIDNANLFKPQGTNRNYHPLPNGDFDNPFPYNNGALDVKLFNSTTGFSSEPTWGGTLNSRKPQSLVLEYRVRAVDPDKPPALQNGFTFAVGILSSALPRFRVFSYGAGCTACCISGGAAGSSGCTNTCAITYAPLDGKAGNGAPLEPDNIIRAAGPSPAPPGMDCYCLQVPAGATPPAPATGCPPGNITNPPPVNATNPSIDRVAYGQSNNPAPNNFGDNSRYYMVFNYVKRESKIESPFVRVQPATVLNPIYATPVFNPPLSEIPVGTTFDIQFRASTNGVGSVGDTTAALTPTQMVSFNNPINQVVNTPFLQFLITTEGDTSTLLLPVIDEIVIPFRYTP